MKPFVFSQLLADDVGLWEKICVAVKCFPDDISLGKYDSGKPAVLSCHILARALSKVFGVDCVDGYFHPFYEHSWLVTRHGNVIDVYPVGILGGPLLVHDTKGFTSPVRHLYEQKPCLLDERMEMPAWRSSFNAAVVIATLAVAKIADEHSLR
jgi:hypothetical protein